MIRVALNSDVAFIKNSWIRCVKNQYPHMYEFEFDERFGRYVCDVIDKANIHIYTFEEDIEQILAYLVFSVWNNNQIVHFAYTKEAARKKGYMNELLKHSNPDGKPVVFTTATRNENIMQALTKKYIYDPSMRWM